MPSRQDPPLGLTDVVQRRAEQNIWHQLGCWSCWKVIMFSINRLRGFTPDFCRVYSLAFPPPGFPKATAAVLHSPGHGCWNLGLLWTKDLRPPSLSSTPGHVEGVTSDLCLVQDEWRARAAELQLPKFRNERFPSPRQIYNQG